MLDPELRGVLVSRLESNDPLLSLRQLMLDLHRETGLSREELLQILAQLAADLRDDNREADEDVVLEVADFLVGWCSPHASLAPLIR